MTKIRFITILLLTVLLALPVAQAKQNSGQQPQQNTEQKPDEDVTVLRQMKGRVFELKNRQPSSVVRVVSPLGSGYKAATINSNDELRTITVRDFPENIAAIEEALKRLDVPEATRPLINLETRVSLVVTSSNSAAVGGDVPTSIAAIMNDLRELLKFKGYRFVTTYINRTSADGSVNSSGLADSLVQMQSADLKEKPCFYKYQFQNIRLVDSQDGEHLIQVRDFNFSAQVPVVVGSFASGPGNNSSPINQIQYKDIGISTALSLKDGETTVVGTTNTGISGEVLVVIVSIRKIK
jgi:type II secretory pathway component GspD/PulD (secretin)